MSNDGATTCQPVMRLTDVHAMLCCPVRFRQHPAMGWPQDVLARGHHVNAWTVAAGPAKSSFEAMFGSKWITALKPAVRERYESHEKKKLERVMRFELTTFTLAR